MNDALGSNLETARTVLSQTAFVLFNPYIMAAIVALILGLFVYFYGFLGFVVITAHPVFLVMLAWTLFLLLIAYIRPLMDRLLKQMNRAIVRYIRRLLRPPKIKIKKIPLRRLRESGETPAQSTYVTVM